MDNNTHNVLSFASFTEKKHAPETLLSKTKPVLITSEFIKLQLDGTIQPQPMIVFYFIIKNIPWGNRLLINRTEVGRKLGMLKQNVHRDFKKLVQANLITPISKFEFMINPHYVYKGTDQYYKAICCKYDHIRRIYMEIYKHEPKTKRTRKTKT